MLTDDEKVRLASSGRQVEVGSFLAPAERQTLVETLEDLLAASDGGMTTGIDTMTTETTGYGDVFVAGGVGSFQPRRHLVNCCSPYWSRACHLFLPVRMP